MGIKATWIICDQDPATTIAIQPLTQIRFYKMGSSIFAAISRLKLASTTRASFPIIPST